MKSKELFVVFLFMFISCNRSYTPKPMGYLKVNYPEKEYVLFNKAEPYLFEYPVYAEVLEDDSRITEPYWYNIYFPEYDGTIHLSYKNLENDVNDYIEDCRILVYKHTSRSDGITELPFIDTVNKRYGILYELNGNVASNVQFFLTDSTEHFLRGSLYFNAAPNSDSLGPVIDFIKEDIVYFMESVKWK